MESGRGYSSTYQQVEKILISSKFHPYKHILGNFKCCPLGPLFLILEYKLIQEKHLPSYHLLCLTIKPVETGIIGKKFLDPLKKL